MKKFFKKIWDSIGIWLLLSPSIIILLVILISSIYGASLSFDNIVEFLTKVGAGFWFLGLINTLLSIIALIQVFRGAVLLLDVDADVFFKKQYWKGVLYLVINILSYITLFNLIKRM